MDLQQRISKPATTATRGTKEFLVSKKTMDAKKVRGPESPLYTAVCPLVYVARVFGLAPYEFHNDMLVPSSINSIYALVCLIVYTYIIYFVMLGFTGKAREKPLLGLTEAAKVACNFSMAIFDIVMTLFTRQKFVRIWNDIQDYDEIVKNLGYARSETRTCVWAWIMLVTNFLTWLSVHKFGMYAFEETWINNVSYMIVYVGSSISIIKFSGMALLLGQRFHHLNAVAKKCSPFNSRWLLTTPMVDSKDIEYLHNILMMTSEKLNSLYSWSLLFWLGNLSMHVVDDFYFVIQRMIAVSWTMTEWRMLSCLLSWIAAFLEQLILLNFACHFAASEILHIEAAQAKIITTARYNLGNAHFELNIRSITVIEDEGLRVIARAVHADIPEIDWDDVADREGDKVCIAGWVKCNFRESPYFNNESSFGFGSITNGHLKLEVRLTSVADLPEGLARGIAVNVTKTVHYGTYLYIKLDSGADIVTTDEEAFDVNRMLNITSPPVKRQRRK